MSTLYEVTLITHDENGSYDTTTWWGTNRQAIDRFGQDAWAAWKTGQVAVIDVQFATWANAA